MSHMAKGEPINVTRAKRLYDTDGDRLKRKHKECPKCGSGTYMADHHDRLACGKCGYTEFKGS